MDLRMAKVPVKAGQPIAFIPKPVSKAGGGDRLSQETRTARAYTHHCVPIVKSNKHLTRSAGQTKMQRILTPAIAKKVLPPASFVWASFISLIAFVGAYKRKKGILKLYLILGAAGIPLQLFAVAAVITLAVLVLAGVDGDILVGKRWMEVPSVYLWIYQSLSVAGNLAIVVVMFYQIAIADKLYTFMRDTHANANAAIQVKDPNKNPIRKENVLYDPCHSQPLTTYGT
eukprot:TRINITY_DN1552_c0_g2_i1.p1 TRINITY_DN1552_c0_g2~~TRINITY_DN1552_c0_g2_i1.p1  ORF type:complete len:229 (+),score=5.72 TRINITY_DN1552_c0_g2_i1:100-786(+)